MNRSIRFGLNGRIVARLVDGKAVVRGAAEFTAMGQSPQRLHALERVTGAAKYAADMRLPGMLDARILRPPAHE
jgi:nicotinate dehydrogenase subunit B